MSAFAKNLKKFRLEKKFSQVQLTKKLNYGYTAIANYESGRNEPSFDVLISLATIFQRSTDELLGFELSGKYFKKNITETENLLISSFRKLTPENQNRILDLAKALQS